MKLMSKDGISYPGSGRGWKQGWELVEGGWAGWAGGWAGWAGPAVLSYQRLVCQFKWDLGEAVIDGLG